jgi:hypothetical protein
MRGMITERHFQTAEECFPGIRRFYFSLEHKPSTFLELVWQYERWFEHVASPQRG